MTATTPRQNGFDPINAVGNFEISRRDLLKASGAMVIGFSLIGEGVLRPGQASAQGPAALPADQLDSWLAIDSEGNVTLFTGKVELGTGVQTALAQIAAEELDVAFDRMSVVQGDTARTVNQGGTWNSQTVAFGGVQVRQAAAEARLALVQLASERLGVPVDDLSVEDGLISAGSDPLKQVSYAELVGGQQLRVSVTQDATPKDPADYTIVGQPIARMDIPGKIMAAGVYVHDLRIPGMLHARTVKPPTIASNLISVDRDSVADVPGLVDIVVKGNFVAVVTEREEHAIEAAQRLKVTWSDWAGLPAMKDQYDVIRATPGTPKVIAEEGDVESSLASSSKRTNATYLYPYQTHGSIGPSCAVAEVQGDTATIYSGTQQPHGIRKIVSDLLDIPFDGVRVIWTSGSGCYGASGSEDATIDAAVISQAVGRPVRLQWMRQEEHRWSSAGPAMVMDLEGGLDETGRVIAWDYQAYTPSHYYSDWLADHLMRQEPTVSDEPPPPQVPVWGGEAKIAYVVDGGNRELVHRLDKALLRSAPLRAPGQIATSFATEGFMDELAALANADPVEFRLRHLTEERAIAVLKAAADLAGWDARPAHSTGNSGQIAGGRGVALIQRPGGSGPNTFVAMVADVEVNRDSGAVAVKRAYVAHDCGLIINPDGLRNQIEGNVVQTTSRALKEQVRFDSGNITSLDWEGYPILTFKEVPTVDITLLDRPDLPAAGAGEPSSCPVTPAIANAIFDAVGARMHEAPFTPDRVKAAMPKAS